MNFEQQAILEYCRKLNKISLQFGEIYRSEKTRLLKNLPALNNSSAQCFISLHDTLLTILAWPENQNLLSLANNAMNKLIASVKERISHESQLKNKLHGTGIAGTEITGHFSYEITRWLVKEFDRSVTLHSWDAKPETIKLFFHQLLPRVEYESVFSGELSPLRRIKKLKGKSTQTDLQWLIMQFEQSSLPDPLKDFLFNEFKIFVTWKLDHSEFTRSFLRMPGQKIFYQKIPGKVAEIKKYSSRRLPAPARLTSAQKIHLANMAKATLILLFRETDPFTFSSTGDLVCFHLQRGFSVALYSLKKEHRLSIESYIGYLVLKNGIPVAYGGGWIFGARCQFGINILEPFRGVESAYIMSQLIRVYYQYYGATRFVVKPYQFGLKNKEGLESGAFWFYYKYGFRPAEEKLQKLADEEWKKKKEGKDYRTPLHTLKKFTKANVQLVLEKDPVPFYDASVVSVAITHFIITAYDGDRMKAINDCIRKTPRDLGIRDLMAWSGREKKVWADWSLLAMANLNIGNWNNDEKKQLIDLIKSKANNSEPDFIKRLQKHKRLWKDLGNKFH